MEEDRGQDNRKEGLGESVEREVIV